MLVHRMLRTIMLIGHRDNIDSSLHTVLGRSQCVRSGTDVVSIGISVCQPLYGTQRASGGNTGQCCDPGIFSKLIFLVDIAEKCDYRWGDRGQASESGTDAGDG
ncbi:hypothetical protein XAXN_13485 [Xanthomonas axonopodis]|uniref:Uncharacterized protein n=1 Tax=Xanthomonas axonopodis TaxID=53413 RepID=A0A0P6V872_9XANT|nr:hypothetical protein XAXN_13485 [Xanthomonas axonopodis]